MNDEKNSSAQLSALIAMSGGVDSSVAACLMKEQGYRCIGATLKLFDDDMIVGGDGSEKADPHAEVLAATREDPGDRTGAATCADLGDRADAATRASVSANTFCGSPYRAENQRSCCSLSDVEDARSVADRLGIPYYVFNYADDFRSKVIDRFVKAYEEGRTPNPCIDCNRYIKFAQLLERGKVLDIDYVVTGHYCRVSYDSGSKRFLLSKSVDLKKDQTYVLYSLTQEQLARVKFPLGDLTKTETRKVAEEYGLINANKRDSQDICFVPNGDYTSFIRKYTGKEYPSGEFVDEDGNVLGTHKGIIRYTIGQRKGLGLALPQPMYVCRKDLEKNQVVLTVNEGLFSDTLEADDFNWIACDIPKSDLRVKARVRYNAKEQPARVIPLSETRVRIEFDEPQRAITAGQAVVLYDGDVVVGGGTIAEA